MIIKYFYFFSGIFFYILICYIYKYIDNIYIFFLIVKFKIFNVLLIKYNHYFILVIKNYTNIINFININLLIFI